jgi:hypothetical protein
MARGLAIRRYEVSELQRLNLRKRGRWLVGLELIEGVSKLKRALARRSIRTISCTFTGEFSIWISSQDIKFFRAVACQRFDLGQVLIFPDPSERLVS